jgi:hypothetical protein
LKAGRHARTITAGRRPPEGDVAEGVNAKLKSHPALAAKPIAARHNETKNDAAKPEKAYKKEER